MGRDDYAVTDVGEYGLRAQPAVATRMRPHLILTRVGLGAACGAVGAAVAAYATFPRFTAWGAAWPALLLGAAIVMLAICGLQAYVWASAMAEWSGRRDVHLAGFLTPSFVAHVLSYAALAVAAVGVALVVGDAGWAVPASWSAMLAFALVTVAQLTSGVEHLRLDGPPGTLPPRFRRVLRAQNPQPPRAEAQANR